MADPHAWASENEALNIQLTIARKRQQRVPPSPHPTASTRQQPALPPSPGARQLPQSSDRGVCRHFHTLGGCARGDRCRFIHESTSTVRPSPSSRRAAPDGNAYTRIEFIDFFGQKEGARAWARASQESETAEPSDGDHQREPCEDVNENDRESESKESKRAWGDESDDEDESSDPSAHVASDSLEACAGDVVIYAGDVVINLSQMIYGNVEGSPFEDDGQRRVDFGGHDDDEVEAHYDPARDYTPTTSRASPALHPPTMPNTSPCILTRTMHGWACSMSRHVQCAAPARLPPPDVPCLCQQPQWGAITHSRAMHAHTRSREPTRMQIESIASAWHACACSGYEWGAILRR